MEKFHIHKTQISKSPLLLLLQFSTLLWFSSAYTLPDKYFINCGSSGIVTYNSRNFTGDESSGSISFTKQSSTTKDANSSSAIYQTARIFNKQSSYLFEIDQFGTYLVRLHFLAFSSELSRANFDVSASGFSLGQGFSLLQNFTAKINNSSPLVKEFFLSINFSKFRLYFTPQGSSLAFVNAIEVFLSPVNFSSQNVTNVGSIQNLWSSSVLHTIYRINVGGQEIDSDMVGRKWDMDDSFLYTPNTAKNTPFYSNKPNYRYEETKTSAPELVYQTAKVLNNQSSNISWGFELNKTAQHVLRVHFCDIISPSLNVLRFYLYINGNFSQLIDPMDYVMELAAPFYIDYVVGYEYSTVMNISIGPSNATDEEKNAFLNGLEILEMVDGLVSVPIENDAHPRKIKVLVVVGSVLGGVALLCILVVGFFFISRRRKQKPGESVDWQHVHLNGGGSSHSRVTELTTNSSNLHNLNLGLKISFAEIQLATKNFDAKLIVGKGGFGSVYKGVLLNGTKVAVKRSAPGSGQGFPEFQTEITVLSKIRHRHLVSLIGYCDEGYEMILVYEFMEKGTLRDHLYDPELPRLSWKQRLEICIGAASGLHYLHKGSSEGTIHRDVKSTNILLDENHVAKVSDFGLSKSGLFDETHVSTNVKGTFGYLDPEYFRTQQLTEKSDVYSFGVVLLEVLCARAAIDVTLPREQMNLAEWGVRCKQKGLLEDIVDPSIKGQINPNSLRKFSETAEKCLQEDY
ncbi:hypothetical protein UlMin_039154 [Ulmus minor]